MTTKCVELRIISVERKPGKFFNAYWKEPCDLITDDDGDQFIADMRLDDFRVDIGKTINAYCYDSGGCTSYLWLSYTPDQKIAGDF